MQKSKNGSITLSLDTEIGWGGILNGRWEIFEKNNIFTSLRPKLKSFLHVLDEYDFPCTWALVGAMIEEKRDFPYPNQQLEKIISSTYSKGQKETFDGQDIFEAILNTKTKHEIAWHTYYHIPYNLIDKNYATKDLKKAEEIAKKNGIVIQSFIFPLNIEQHYESIALSNIKFCRGTIDRYEKGSTIRKLDQLYTLLLSVPPESTYKLIHRYLLRISGSMFLKPPKNIFILIKLYELMAKRSIDAAIKYKKNFHFWIHPFNFAQSPQLYLSIIEIVKYASKKRSSGQLDILKMSDFNYYLK